MLVFRAPPTSSYDRSKRSDRDLAEGHLTNARSVTDDPANESALCQACGLCCQGQLYGWVKLLPHEVALAESWPVEMIRHEAASGFKQPCGCFREQRCTVYAERPQTCVNYRCRLLLGLGQGEISQAMALGRVAQARGLFDKLQRQLPPTTGKRIWERIIDRWDLPAFRSLLASGEIDSDTLMTILALDVLLTKYFRTDKDKRRLKTLPV